MESVEITGTTRCSFMYALLSLSVKPSRYLPQRDRARMALRLPFRAALWLHLTKAAERPGALLLALPNCSGLGTRKQTRTPPGSRGQAVRAAYPNAGTRPRPVLRGANPAPGRSPPARRGRGKRSAGSARRAQPSAAGARGRPGWVPAASGHPPGLAPPQAL